jgi:hypothetical protein
MSYSPHAFALGGYLIPFTGSKGRLEHVARRRCTSAATGVTPRADPEGTSIKITPISSRVTLEIWESEGGHGGDPALAEDLFGENPPAGPSLCDPYPAPPTSAPKIVHPDRGRR